MKKLLVALLFTASIFNFISANAVEHPAGHGSASRGASGTCLKPKLEKFLPANMTSVAPGATFSFAAFNIEDPEQIEVTAKKLPVAVTNEFKAPFYLITGHLPASLSNTVARINIKVNAKAPACEAEAGWLVKITE